MSERLQKKKLGQNWLIPGTHQPIVRNLNGSPLSSPYERNYYLDVSTRTRNSSLPWGVILMNSSRTQKRRILRRILRGNTHANHHRLGACNSPNLQGEASIIYQGFKLQALKGWFFVGLIVLPPILREMIPNLDLRIFFRWWLETWNHQLVKRRTFQFLDPTKLKLFGHPTTMIGQPIPLSKYKFVRYHEIW